MAEPRRTPAAPADKPETETSDAAKHTAKDRRVMLRCVQRYNVFEPGNDLPAVTYAGTEYTAAQADDVRTSARKHGVRVVVVPSAEES